jgi:hypothetical protein
MHAKIILPGTWGPATERISDRILMDAFEALKTLSKRQMRLVNNWRMFYQALTLSDLTNAAGDRIEAYYLHQPATNESNPHRQSKLKWPVQPLPGPKGHRCWIKCLKMCFGMAADGRLAQKLGAWTISTSQSSSEYTNYLNLQSNDLYVFQRHLKNYQCYLPHHARTKSIRFDQEPSGVINVLPDNCIPCDLTKIGNITTTRKDSYIQIEPI